MGILPHRYPFLLVDRVLEIDPGVNIVALKNVTFNEPFFQGHFPQYKVMPGVLIIEAMAQAGGILLFHSLDKPETKLVFLSKINNAKFRKPVVPGDQLEMHVTLLKFRKGFCQIEAKSYVDGQVVAEAEIMASVIELEDLHAGS
jgi:3-hydroxyacyl-[acyl-carrier-protein] dehydratase/UDP-3-O-[3-hydroxymyristoyl] N-acetylglucosamine deacetylase/3-hydroxyacyl-[acyl-carrier-protein] dehydratase